MAILKRTEDFVVCFWYAENADGDNFFMVLKKKATCWQLNWRFASKVTKTKYYHALSGLQTPEKQVMHEGCETFKLTREEFPLKRIDRRLVGGDEWKLRIMLRQYKLIW